MSVTTKNEMDVSAHTITSGVTMENGMYTLYNELNISSKTFNQFDIVSRSRILQATMKLSASDGNVDRAFQSDPFLKRFFESLRVDHRFIFETEKKPNLQMLTALIPTFSQCTCNIPLHVHARVRDFLGQYGKSPGKKGFLRIAERFANKVIHCFDPEAFLNLLEFAMAIFEEQVDAKSEELEACIRNELSNIGKLKKGEEAKVREHCLREFCNLAVKPTKTRTNCLRELVETSLDDNFLDKMSESYLEDLHGEVAGAMVGVLDIVPGKTPDEIVAYIRQALESGECVKFADSISALYHFHKHSAPDSMVESNLAAALKYISDIQILILGCKLPVFRWSQDGEVGRVMYKCGAAKVIVLKRDGIFLASGH